MASESLTGGLCEVMSPCHYQGEDVFLAASVSGLVWGRGVSGGCW